MDRCFISVKEFCQAANIGRTTANQLIRVQQVQSVRLGARRLLVLASVEEFIQRLLDEQARSTVGMSSKADAMPAHGR